ncbi:hypothetical protein RJ641_031086 [Dillenia turbinata]|uniref:Uncharacterized protein n=1 Tax=Dillenia turbinata TaxID=194707 RepID=A0AAN8ZKL4_9MAGN
MAKQELNLEQQEDYSASATLIFFDRPISLLRVPIPASSSESSTPFVLAFKDSNSFNSAFRACKSKLTEQCEAGARIGCAISASNKCKPPFWRSLTGGGTTPQDLKEREICEEREMEGCVAVAKEKCVTFANDKCLKPFSEARVGLNQFDSMEVTNYRGRELLGVDFKESQELPSNESRKGCVIL